jgi:hypothetical protein
MRGAALRANAEIRAKVIRNDAFLAIVGGELEANFAAIYLARRFFYAVPPACTFAALVSLGRAFG